MKKTELIDYIIAQQSNLPPSDVILAFECTLDFLAQSLSQQGRIEIRGFGSIQLNHQAEKKAFNPKTRQQISVSDRNKIRFKMGDPLKKRLNAHEEES